MRLLDISKSLRDTAYKYGGMKHFHAAADGLDEALKHFQRSKDTDGLRALTGATSHALRMHKQLEPETETGPRDSPEPGAKSGA